MTARVEAMLASLRRRHLRAALADRLRRGRRSTGSVTRCIATATRGPGIAQAAGRILSCRSPERGFAADLAEAAAAVLRERPTLDFALAAVARVLRLPLGAPLTLFAIGRTIGWIGHAIEQYSADQIIRPRAKYVGDVPAEPRPGPG